MIPHTPGCPDLPAEFRAGCYGGKGCREPSPLSPGPSPQHLHVQCGLRDPVTGLGLPITSAARGAGSGHPQHMPTVPTSALAPRDTGTHTQTDRSVWLVLCPNRRQPSPEGQSPARRERPPCSQESSLKRELFHSKASPGIVSEGGRYWPTLPGPDLGPDGAQEEGVGDRAELDQPLPWGASLEAQPCTTPAQSTGQRRSRQPGAGAKCVYPPSHRDRGHLPEAETLQAGGTRKPSWEGEAEP